MRISKKDPFGWFIKNFGIGGVDNYTDEQVRDILRGLRLILERTGAYEQRWLGLFLVKLSEDADACSKMLDRLIELGY